MKDAIIFDPLKTLLQEEIHFFSLYLFKYKTPYLFSYFLQLMSNIIENKNKKPHKTNITSWPYPLYPNHPIVVQQTIKNKMAIFFENGIRILFFMFFSCAL